MGKSTSEVLRLAEQGQVTYPIVVKAIAELTKEGASFYNGAEKGGTDLDRSLNQLTGAFENLQTIIGTAVGPAVTQVIKGVTKSLSDAVLVIQLMQAELNKLKFPPGFIENGQKIGVFPRTFDQLTEGVKKTAFSFNPLTAQLTKSIDLFKILGIYYEKFGFGKNFAVPDKTAASAAKPSTANSEEAARQKYLADIAKKNTADVLADKLKKETETNDKIAKINKDKELQLGDARLNYERQIADFRQATLQRIADMERTLQDQRVKANFDLQQSNLKLAGQGQFTNQTIGIIKATQAGKSPAEIGLLEAARDSAKSLNDAAVTRRQIEFDSTMKKIQLERTLTDFKKGIEREIGEMQKGYARQTGDILTKAGTNIQLAMIKGAQEVAAIMMRIGTGMTPPAAPTLPAANSQLVRKANDQPNQQANSAAAGVGRIITPEMARSRRAATLQRSDPATMAGRQGPLGSRADSVDAANNIKPFSPATAKLDSDTNELKRLVTEDKIKQIMAGQVEETSRLALATQSVVTASESNLVSAQQKNQVDQRTLDLMLSGTNPALAAQFAQNEQLKAQGDAELEKQRNKIVDSLKEEDLSKKQIVLREKLIGTIDKQIAKQPQILEGLNQQAIKQKQINDASAEFTSKQESIKGLVQGIGASIESGIIGAIDGAITGAKSLQESLADILKDIGKMLISFGVKTLLSSISPTIDGTRVFGGGKAAGGPVSGNSTYMVGEKGPELFVPSTAGTIIPADATAAAMARYQRQGGGSGGGNSSSDAMGDGAAATPVLSMSFETTRFLGQDYVSTDQLQAAMMATEKRAAASGAKAGAAQVASQMRNSPGYRRQVGLR